MNRDTLAPYHVQRRPAPFADDGYDRIPQMRRAAWRPVAAWGRDGYDLGDWPLVVFYAQTLGPENPDAFRLATDVEGDLDVYAFPTLELRNEATDYLFAWYAVHAGHDWAAGWDPENAASIPAEMRGPYRPAPAVVA